MTYQQAQHELKNWLDEQPGKALYYTDVNHICNYLSTLSGVCKLFFLDTIRKEGYTVKVRK